MRFRTSPSSNPALTAAGPDDGGVLLGISGGVIGVGGVLLGISGGVIVIGDDPDSGNSTGLDTFPILLQPRLRVLASAPTPPAH